VQSGWRGQIESEVTVPIVYRENRQTTVDSFLTVGRRGVGGERDVQGILSLRWLTSSFDY
jgi:hypothetical protein